MARCEPNTRANLLSNYLLMPSEVVGNLRTAIAGPDYAVRNHDLTSGDGFIGAYDAAAGVIAAWPDLGASEVVDTTTARVWIAEALARYFSESAGTPNASNGIQNGTVVNEIIHDGGSTVWSGPSRSVSVITDVVVGDHVYLDTDGAGANAFETTITEIKYASGQPTILVLADTLPAVFTGGAFFNINISEIISPETQLPSTDYTATTAQISVAAGVTVTTTRTGVAVPIATSIGTTYSQTYVDYRALRQANVGSILTITNESQLDTYFIGWDDPESGLGFAVWQALAPQPDPALTDLPAVLAVAVESNDTTGWSELIDRLSNRYDWYTIAPLTLDSTIHSQVYTMLAEREANGLDSRAFVCLELIEETTLFTGSETVTLSNGDLTLTSTNPIFAGAVAGDRVTTNIGERIIDTVTSNQTVTVTVAATGATTVTQIIHPLTISEQADNYGARAQTLADQDVSVVFPPNPTWMGEVVDGFLYSAACAGLRGYTMPHQSLTAVAMDSRWGVPQSAYEFLGELDDMSNYGCFVSEDCDSEAVILSAYTTDQSEVLTQTEGIVANVDAVIRYFNDLLSCYEGRTKITYDTLAAVRAEASSGIEFLKSQTQVAGFGSVIIGGTVGAPVVVGSTVTLPISIVIAAGMERVTVAVTVTLEVG